MQSEFDHVIKRYLQTFLYLSISNLNNRLKFFKLLKLL